VRAWILFQRIVSSIASQICVLIFRLEYETIITKHKTLGMWRELTLSCMPPLLTISVLLGVTIGSVVACPISEMGPTPLPRSTKARWISADHIWSNYMSDTHTHTYRYIQSVPGGKVSILGGRSISHSKKKSVCICTCVLFWTVSEIELFHCIDKQHAVPTLSLEQ
jgi:hypothetical protein